MPRADALPEAEMDDARWRALLGRRWGPHAAAARARNRPGRPMAHACLRCRRSFKLREGPARRCPACAGPLLPMGEAFRVPPRADREAWAAAAALRSAGFLFLPAAALRDLGPAREPFPRRLRDVAGFLKRNADHPARCAPRQGQATPHFPDRSIRF